MKSYFSAVPADSACPLDVWAGKAQEDCVRRAIAQTSRGQAESAGTAGYFCTSSKLLYAVFILLVPLMLFGCVSSNVSREVASNTDQGVQRARDMANGTGDGSIADTYQNASQAAKGAVMGGAAGAVTGAMVSSVGVIPGAVTGAILGASYGSYIDANMTLQDQLESRGAIVVMLGDQLLIVLPAARIFHAETPRIKTQAYDTLYLLTRYINSFNKTLVKVTAYTNGPGNAKVNLSLSTQQADNVAKFLLAAGVDARVLYAAGAGSTHPIEAEDDSDESENNRIEITLEKLNG